VLHPEDTALARAFYQGELQNVVRENLTTFRRLDGCFSPADLRPANQAQASPQSRTMTAQALRDPHQSDNNRGKCEG